LLSSSAVVELASVEEVLEAQRREPPWEDEDDADEAEDAVEDEDDERNAAGVTASTGSSIDSASATGGVWGAGADDLLQCVWTAGRAGEQREREGEENEREGDSNLMLTNFSHLPKDSLEVR
jgi:hypothetical protein